MKTNKKEIKIVLLATLSTVLIILAFTMSQGSMKSKEDNYVSQVKAVTTKKEKVQESIQIEEELEDVVPKDFKVLNIEQKEDITKIEAIIENIEDEKEALAQIKILGSVLRDANPDKDMGTLNIIAYTSDKKEESFEYHGENKNTIIKNTYEEVR